MEDCNDAPAEQQAQVTEEKPADKKKRAGEVLKNYFTATRVSYMEIGRASWRERVCMFV